MPSTHPIKKPNARSPSSDSSSSSCCSSSSGASSHGQSHKDPNERTTSPTPYIPPTADYPLVSPTPGRRHPHCSVCNAQFAYWCKTCLSSGYCSLKHKTLDTTHNLFCVPFSLLPPVSERAAECRLVIMFPEKALDPILRFEKMPAVADAHYHDVKAVCWDVTTDPSVPIPPVRFALDHVIRIVRVEAAEGKKLGRNKSIVKWGDSDGWKGDVVVRSYVKGFESEEMKWLDCSLADFRHVLIYFRRHHGWCRSWRAGYGGKGTIVEREFSPERDEKVRSKKKTWSDN